MIPHLYEWLTKEPAPKMLVEALKLYGTKEKTGDENNPVILEWAKHLDLKDYNADSIPWCGLFMAYIADLAGKPLPANPLWARNWASFGNPCTPELGCVLVFNRAGGGGHVGLYVGEDKHAFYHVLGGNQGDAVSFTRIPKERLVAARAFYTNRPKSIRKVFLNPEGAITTGEQ